MKIDFALLDKNGRGWCNVLKEKANEHEGASKYLTRVRFE